MTRARIFSFPVLIIMLAGLLAGCADETTSPTGLTTAAVDTAELDAAPPAIPTGLAASATGTMVKIRWEPNTSDRDLAGFRVYRLAFGNSYLLTETLIPENFYLDTRPLRAACLYAVTAVDRGGNESPWQTVPYDSNPDLLERADVAPGD